MARSIWKGHLTIAAINCPVALFAAASTSERVSFHIVNRKTGNRVRREFVDSETEELVEKDDQIKGYEVSQGEFVHLTPEEIASAIPDSDKSLNVLQFLPCNAVDTVYFDRPYYIAPATDDATPLFNLIRDGLAREGVAALARTVLFRRVRTMLIRVQDDGLVGSTLNYADEVRPADDVFKDVKAIKLQGEMLDLARHIISTKEGEFDPAAFDDRYDAALAQLVKAKIEGRKIKRPPTPKASAGGDLLDALRQSAGQAKPPPRKSTPKARKAG